MIGPFTVTVTRVTTTDQQLCMHGVLGGSVVAFARWAQLL